MNSVGERLHPRVSIFAWLAVLFIGVGTSLVQFGVQGPATAGIALLGLIVLAFDRGVAQAPSLEPRNLRPAPMSLFMIAFVVWSGALLLTNYTVQGLQNWLVWLLLPLTAVLVSHHTTRGTGRVVHRWWRVAALASGGYYLYLVASTGEPGYADGFFSARGAGWSAVTALALLVPWAAINKSTKLAWLPVFLMAVVAGASTTRTATAVAGILLIGLVAKGVRAHGRTLAGKLRILVAAAIVGYAIFAAMTRVPALRDRFLKGDAAYEYNGIRFNTSGRNELWAAMWQAIPEHFWVGHGPGQSQYFIRARYETIEHPHNEYLRMWFDTGIIGLALWTFGLLAIAWSASRRYKRAARNEDKALHLAAQFGVLVLLLGAITDNLSVTLPTALAVGALVGLSLGRAKPAQDGRGHESPTGPESKLDAGQALSR